MHVRAYKLINRSEGLALAARLQAIAQSWADRYATTGVTAEVTAHAGLDALEAAPTSTWMIAKEAGGIALAIALPKEWPRQLARWTLAGSAAAALSPPGFQLVSQMGMRLLQELGQSIYVAVRPGAGTSKPLEWTAQEASPLPGSRTGDPFVGCECQIGDAFSLQLVLWPAVVAPALAPLVPKPSAEPVAPLSRALDRQPVHLDAIAGAAEVAFQELFTLVPGDVLKLDRALSDPIELHVRGGTAVCSARLGVSRGRLALQLTQQS
jgi:hypothetical protein